MPGYVTGIEYTQLTNFVSMQQTMYRLTRMRLKWILALISCLLLSSNLAWASSPDDSFKYTSTEMGEKYYYGRGVPQNYDEAFKWFLKAAEEGDSNAQVLVGYMYQEGQGVKQDYNKALK